MFLLAVPEVRLRMERRKKNSGSSIVLPDSSSDKMILT